MNCDQMLRERVCKVSHSSLEDLKKFFIARGDYVLLRFFDVDWLQGKPVFIVKYLHFHRESHLMENTEYIGNVIYLNVLLGESL